MKKDPIIKRDTSAAPIVEQLTESKGKNYPRGRMLIASPLAVEAIMYRVPKGKVLRLSDLRSALARQFDADYTCPLTTGIFVRIVAEAADLEAAQGKKNTAPYWRVVRDDGALIDKLPGGTDAQQSRLMSEHVECSGRRARVTDLRTLAFHL